MKLPLSDTQLQASEPPLIWDNTMRMQLLQCPRKLYFFLCGYDYISKPAYFTFGSAYHEFLHYWHLYDSDPAHFDEALTKALELWDSEAPISFGDNTRENLIRLCTAYVEFYPKEPWHVIPDGGEVGWSYPLPPCNFLKNSYSLGGSMDSRIEWPGYGVLIREDKSEGGWLSRGYIDSYIFSPQVTGYIWYDTQLQGSQTFGALVNMASKKVAKAGTTPRFKRSLQQRSQKELDDFILAFQFDLLRFEFFWESWKWPKTCDTINCVGGKGKSVCLFKEVCKSTRDMPLDKIDPLSFENVGHREKLWKPWKRKGEQE